MKTIRARWQTTILVCGKCSRRQGGGFGKKGRTPLAKLLRAIGNGRKGPKADVAAIETKCLGLCPKHAVVAINAARPRDWLLVPPGAALEAIVEQLGIPEDAHAR